MAGTFSASPSLSNAAAAVFPAAHCLPRTCLSLAGSLISTHQSRWHTSTKWRWCCLHHLLVSATAGSRRSNGSVRHSWFPHDKVAVRGEVRKGRLRISRCGASEGDVTDSDAAGLLSQPESKSSSFSSSLSARAVDPAGTDLHVECPVDSNSLEKDEGGNREEFDISRGLPSRGSIWWEWAVLVSPFFFWGTAMVAMKQLVPKAGPFFVGAFRLIPAGFLLIAYAAFQRRTMPSGFSAWLSITLFALVDGACFQGFLAEGLQTTSAGLGSVIIDSQPLTVAILAALLFDESIDLIGATGLLLGVAGLLLLEVPTLALDGNNFSFWGSGEFWMLLAAQSMAVGTVMVRWVSKYADPVMATGWHMVIGGVPLVAASIVNNDPAVGGSVGELTAADLSALLYTSILGSAVSYGVFFYNATKGSLTKFSSLTFLTPVFASVFGFFYLGETYSPVQLAGAFLTLVAIFLVNYERR